MRRLSQPDDRGAATLLVVLIAPVLILCASFVFDGGRGVVARGQTQSAADAGALAKATDCAKSISTTVFASYQTNGAVLANSPICDNGTNTTTVSMTRTITSTFPLGVGPWVVTRSASAKWGAISSATTIPATISACNFDLSTSNGTVFPSAEIVVPIGGGGPTCPGRPPGNFGWLDRPTSSTCAVTTTLNATGSLVAGGDNGNGTGLPYDCINGEHGGGIGQRVLVPIYNATAGNGTNTTYTIIGYALFELTGFELKHGSPSKYPAGGLAGCDSKNCIRGRFLEFVTGQGSTGPATDFGATVVSLVS